MISTEVYKWMYQHFQENPINNCPIKKEELLSELAKIINKRIEHNEKVQLSLDPLRREVLDIMNSLNATIRNPVTAQEIWERSSLLQHERQVMGVTNLLKKMVEDGIVKKVPRPDPRYQVTYYINPNCKKG